MQLASFETSKQSNATRQRKACMPSAKRRIFSSAGHVFPCSLPPVQPSLSSPHTYACYMFIPHHKLVIIKISNACEVSMPSTVRLNSTYTSVTTFPCITVWVSMGRDSSVGIATRYGLDGPGIESRCVPDLPFPSRSALGPTQRPIQWVPGLSRG